MAKHVTINVAGQALPDSPKASVAHPRTPYPLGDPTAKPHLPEFPIGIGAFGICPPESSYTSFIPTRPTLPAPPSLPDIDRVLGLSTSPSKSPSHSSSSRSEMVEIFSRFQEKPTSNRKLPTKRIHMAISLLSLVVSITALAIVVVIYTDLHK
ncbi:hypothetical protein DSO57_1037672 [Entomophthora muscae]|uniref:Uncharacterized protein n=1 Tax=Entomophthora muscae TaxID=34485 RepID=A0ACC2RE19_9FUNG|nr:hypothetical protein DSO57_1037672 [Entomophthora muscae]